MRILYHHRTLADGAEGIHIAEMVSAFRQLGHEVWVRGLAASEGPARRDVHIERLKRRLPAAAFELACVASNAPDYLDMRRAIRTLGPDFLYKRHARMDVAALSAARSSSIPTVLEVNCLFSADQYHRFEPMALGALARGLERRSLELADVVLAVSTPLAREIERVASVQAVVMPNGADPVRFDPACVSGERVRARYGLGYELTVGWAGVMREWHGLELLLDAVARTPGVRLLLVGDGPARSAVEQHAHARGLGDRTVITGRVPQENMPEYVAAMDLAVVAGDETGVASPMKLLEYMAMERAVVAPRQDNIRDLVTDDRDGLLFSPGSAEDLEGVLRRLAGDEPLRRALGREARRTILERRTWRRNAERVLALVDRIDPKVGRVALGKSSS